TRWIALAGAVVLVVLVIGVVILRRGGGAAAEADVVATATITTAPVRSELLQDVTTLYGVVQADPGASRTLAAPRALIVNQVLVRPGEAVGAGQALVSVANAPATEVAYRQAADAVASARSDLARVQRLFDAHLAASDQLIAAKKTLADAEASLARPPWWSASRPLPATTSRKTRR